MNAEPRRPAERLDAGRLWAGGFATAVVAPKGAGLWGNANTTTYALAAGGAALAATALLHLLAVTTPRFGSFFTWIMSLATTIATALPSASRPPRPAGPRRPSSTS